MEKGCVLARQMRSYFLALMIRYRCFSVASFPLSLSKLLVINKVMWGMQKDSSNPKTWKRKPFDLLFRIRIFISKRMNKRMNGIVLFHCQRMSNTRSTPISHSFGNSLYFNFPTPLLLYPNSLHSISINIL